MSRISTLSLLLAGLVVAAWVVPPASGQTLMRPGAQSGQQAGFGGAVAAGATNVFVGEPRNSVKPGIVYVYGPDTEGAWAEQAQLVAPDGTVGDRFGSAIAVDGATVLIGATRQDSARGAAYVFEWDAGAEQWLDSGRLTISGSEAGENAGSAVALAGDLAVVGVPGRMDEQGTVLVYRKAEGGWLPDATLTASDGVGGDRFGEAVTVADGSILIGAPRKGAGVVYTFRYDEEGDAWVEHVTLSDNTMDADARFGSALTYRDGELVVGAPRHANRMGAVVAYSMDADGSWNRESRLLPYDGADRYAFGSSVSLTEQGVWIGAPGAAGFLGHLYNYTMDPSSGAWVGASRISGMETQRGDLFAGAVAVQGAVGVVGIAGDDYGAGRAAIYERDTSGTWQQVAVVLSEIETLPSVTGGPVNCDGGRAAGFACEDVDVLAFLPIQDIGGGRGVRLNDVWGWTDPETGREYALVGRMDGTSFVDITDPSNPTYLGNLPRTEGSPASVWRDMKVYQNHAFIVADAAGQHGMQVFDLAQLRGLADVPVTFEETARYDAIHSAHNIVINEESGFAYAVGNSSGGETCGGGLHMIDVRDPKNPTFAGCFADPTTGRASTGYSHDAQCINYKGPDTDYQGSEICFGSNETALSIADVTDKANPVAVATAQYPNVSYTHQGWITPDHRFFFVNDELDEIGGNAPNTRTLIWDVTDLDDPQLVREYLQETTSSDHNLYIEGRYMYQSNYATGLQIFDISDVDNPVRVAHFDTVPYGSDGPGFIGSWSNYPFFESGTLVVTSIGEGLFLLKKRSVDI